MYTGGVGQEEQNPARDRRIGPPYVCHSSSRSSAPALRDGLASLSFLAPTASLIYIDCISSSTLQALWAEKVRPCSSPLPATLVARARSTSAVAPPIPSPHFPVPLPADRPLMHRTLRAPSPLHSRNDSRDNAIGRSRMRHGSSSESGGATVAGRQPTGVGGRSGIPMSRPCWMLWV